MKKLLVWGLLVAAARVPAFERDVHEDITRELGFIDECVLQSIVESNKSRDDLLYFVTRKRDFWHFNDCDFAGSAANIEATYEAVLEHLEPARPAGPVRAAELYGNLLHTIQDFYAHSNWTELRQPGPDECSPEVDEQPSIVDATFGEWLPMVPWSVRNGVVFVQGEPPPGYAVSWCPHSKKAVATVPGSPKLKAVVTGKVYYAYFANWFPYCNHCPEQMGALHWDRPRAFASSDDGPNRLHKDEKGYSWHPEAVELAKEQTRQEWCRLVNRVDQRYPNGGVKALFSAWVKDVSAARKMCSVPGFPVDAAKFP